MVWDERRVVNGDMGTGDEEYRSGLHLTYCHLPTACKTNVSSFPGLETCFTNKSVDFVSWKKISYFCATSLLLAMRGIEWSLRAFADMQAVRLICEQEQR